MRRLFPFIALVLLYAFTPGLCELAETVAHFTSTGDLHGSDEERHSKHGDSEDKGGECHTCICHAPGAFLVGPRVAASCPVSSSEEPGVFALADSAGVGSIRELYRPPIA